MKRCEFVFDTKVGQTFNRNYDEDKKYVLKILDLLYENYERIRYVDDLSNSKTGKKKWAVLISEKFARMDKRVPIPQVPFNFEVDGKNMFTMKPKHAFLMLVGFFEMLDEEIFVALNFKDKYYREIFLSNLEYNLVNKS